MPLLELAQGQEFEFANESEREVQFEAQLDNGSEDELSLIIYYDGSGKPSHAQLRLNSDDPERITFEQANALIPPEARQQQREAAEIQHNDPPGELEDDPDQRVSTRSATVERVIFPVDQRVAPEQVHAYLPVERGQQEPNSYFKLDQIRHDIVVGAANYDRSDPVIAAAAANYYAGKADLYNELRAEMIRENPSLESSLPWEINRMAIETPEIQEERDRAHEQPGQSLAVA